jgi:hypothetical protein
MVYIQEVEKVYQEWVMARRAEGKAEGKLEGEIALVIKLLTRKIGDMPPDLVARIGLLSLERVEDLVGWVRVFGWEPVNDLGVLTPSPPIEGRDAAPQTPLRKG